MKKILLIIVLAMLCLNSRINAQDTISTGGLKIGDTVPDITINSILNYPNKTAKISNFKGKLLILDFWATWCAPCVSLIPRMDSLQAIYKDNLQLLSVAYQSKDEIESFVRKYSKEKKFHFNTLQVTEDTILRELFPHRTLPHYVWIGRNGVVIAITEYSEINTKNIDKYLKLEQPPSTIKSTIEKNYNPYNPLFKINLNETSRKISSLITGYVDGIGCGFYHNINNPDAHIKRITARNLTVPQLYQLAFGQGKMNIGFNRTVLNVKDRNSVISKESGQKYGQWLDENHGFCYELVVQDTNLDPFSIMLQDLSRAFPKYTASFGDQEVESLVLRKTNAVNIKVDTSQTPTVKFESTGCVLKNRPLQDLTRYLDYYVMQLLQMPVIDESGVEGNVDLTINADLGDVSAVNKELEKYGLQFFKAKRKVRMLIFSESNFNPPPKK